MSGSLQGLQAMILLDQYESWQSGGRPLVESYLQLVQELNSDKQRLMDVIYQEILLRESMGEHPGVDEYVQRFPQLADELRLQFEVHTSWPAEAEPPMLEAQVETPLIEGYRIENELGRGTFGVVYRAWEHALQRYVAIKVLPRGTGGPDSKGELSFAEAQAIAQLSHPLIVPIHAVGEIDAGVYFSQDLLTHGTLSDYCQGQRQSPRTAAECIARLADAVQHAHMRRLVHCDLKPANILLRPRASVSNGERARDLSDFDPLISDFGLAVHLDADSRAFQGHLRGTLAYMSPEQTGIKGGSIGPATDVYALGTILYELLTGRPPFADDSRLGTFLCIRQSSPQEPRMLHGGISSDLNAVCLKCLEKDPGQRYASAAALAEDLRRCLAGYAPLIVVASPIGRLQRWCRRRPLVAGLSTALILLAAGSFAVIAQKMHEARQAEHKERQRADELDAALYRNQFLLAENAFEAADVRQTRAILARTNPQRRSLEWHVLERLCQRAQTAIPWKGHDIGNLAISSDGGILAVADQVDAVTLVELPSGRVRHRLPGHGTRLTPPRFHPRGKLLAAAGMDEDSNWIWIWDVATGRDVIRIGPLPGQPVDLEFADQGTRILSVAVDQLANPGRLVFDTWDVESASRVRSITGPATNQAWPPKGRLSANGHRFAWTPGTLLPSRSGQQYRVHLVDAETGQDHATLNAHSRQIHVLAFSPDSELLTSWDDSGQGILWNMKNGALIHRLCGPKDAVLTAAFSGDGEALAAGGRDQTVTLWDPHTGTQEEVLRGHSSLLRSVVFVPETARLISADQENNLISWNLDRTISQGLQHQPAVTRLAFGGNADDLLVADLSGRIQRLNLPSAGRSNVPGEEISQGVDFVVGPPDAMITSVDAGGNLRIETDTVPGLPPLRTSGSSPLALTGDGRLLFCLSNTGRDIFLVDPGLKSMTGKLSSTGPGWLALACSADGAFLAAASEDQSIQVWDLPQRTLRTTISTEFPVRSLAFRPGSAELAAIAAQDQFVQFWTAGTGQPVRRLTGHKLQITCLNFTPDGRRLLTGSADRTAKIWDSESGEELLTLETPEDEVRGVAVSGDGQSMAVSCGILPERSVIFVF